MDLTPEFRRPSVIDQGTRFLHRGTLLMRFVSTVPDDLTDFELLPATADVPSVRFVRDAPELPEPADLERQVFGYEGTRTYSDPTAALIAEHWTNDSAVGSAEALNRRALSYCYEASRLVYTDFWFDAVERNQVFTESGTQFTKGCMRWPPWVSEHPRLRGHSLYVRPMQFCAWPALAAAIQRVDEAPDANSPFMQRALWEFAQATEARTADHRFEHLVKAVEAIIQTDQGRSTVQFADELAKTYRGLRRRPHASYKRLLESHYERRSATTHAMRFLEKGDHRPLKHLEFTVRTFLRRLLLDREFARGVHKRRTDRLNQRAQTPRQAPAEAAQVRKRKKAASSRR